MGFYRAIYYILGLEYIGEYEQKQIDRQKHLKYLMHKQLVLTNKKRNIKKILIKAKPKKTMSLSEFLKQPIIKN